MSGAQAVEILRERWRAALEELDRSRADAVADEAIEAFGVANFADDVVRHALQRLGLQGEAGERSLGLGGAGEPTSRPRRRPYDITGSGRTRSAIRSTWGAIAARPQSSAIRVSWIGGTRFIGESVRGIGT
jgi:hypothetical protein